MIYSRFLMGRFNQCQVSSHYEDLLSQAKGVQQLEKHLDMMQRFEMETSMPFTEKFWFHKGLSISEKMVDRQF